MYNKITQRYVNYLSNGPIHYFTKFNFRKYYKY